MERPSTEFHDDSTSTLNLINDPQISAVSFRNIPIPSMKRGKTTVARRVKTVKLSNEGNFVVKQRIPVELINEAKYQKGEEFETMRYSACTSDADDFSRDNFDTRISNYNRSIELLIVVTMYNEDEDAFNRTMFGLSQCIKHLCEKNKYGWDENGWKKVGIVLVSDGRSKVNPNVLKVLEVMGVYQEGIAQSAVNGKETTGHIFEYTAQQVMDPNRKLWKSEHGIRPLQMIFCLKEKNLKKINSHRWFFNAFCPLINPKVTVLMDVGTNPEPKSLYYLWKAFFLNDQVAGACGEIRADLGNGMQKIKNLANPLVASQNFEYKISNLLDKSLESVFGYISVLPGAFSAYRYTALQNLGPGVGPLSKYFEGEQRVGHISPTSSSVFSANLYLAEDRILCFELISRKDANYVLHYVKKAYADTDVPDTIPEFLSQRRRWLNGSLFAGFYTLANAGRIWESKHSLLRKFVFTIQFIYNIVNQIFSWFILGNFAVTFSFLFAELRSILIGPEDPFRISTPNVRNRIISGIIAAAYYSYPVILICLFVISFGNRPQAFTGVYKTVMILFGVIGTIMLTLLVRRFVILISSSALNPNADALNSLLSGIRTTSADTISTMQSQEFPDLAQVLINSMIGNITLVAQQMLKENLQNQSSQALTYVIALASTFGVFFGASLLQGDFAHMITSFLQYLLLLPSYINVLTVYSLSNLHDVSWGTKGSDKAESLPSILAKKSADGNMVADVNVVADREDLSKLYIENLQDLQSRNSIEEVKVVDHNQQQEDEYKAFRTKMILFYIFTNALLYLVVTQVVSGDSYIIILLWSIAGLSILKLLGVILFITFRVVNELFSCCNTNKRKYKEEKKSRMLNNFPDNTSLARNYTYQSSQSSASSSHTITGSPNYGNIREYGNNERLGVSAQDDRVSKHYSTSFEV